MMTQETRNNRTTITAPELPGPVRISIVAALSVALLLLATSPTRAEPTGHDDASPQSALAWGTDLPAALAAAAVHERSVLLRFTANWCAPCRVMDASVWPEERVQAELAENFILVKVDIDDASGRALARRFGVRAVPTLVQLDPEGAEIGRGNFMSVTQMLAFLQTDSAP